MVKWATRLFLAFLLLAALRPAFAVDGRFDLVGPKIDIRVTRGNNTLPIASVPNLQPGDKIWLHPDLPPTQSVKYLLICVFLRGTTNPPPENWFYRIETWNKKVRDEGVFITVPDEAQQAVLFLAPETGGDFSTLKSAVRGTPGIFVRASQDLAEAGFEQARIERYVADIRRVPPADTAELQNHSDLLARTLALKPNADCYKRPVDQQFNCLTQSGSQVLLDDGHGQSIVASLSNGPGSDLINQASYTQLAGAGTYSAYVGAIVDLVRIMGSLHTAQYRYIPAIAFPQGQALNLRLNTPPSFHNPKSVLVIGLPSIQAVQTPPLRPADPAHVACLLQPSVVLQVDGAPLVFSTDFATNLILHLNTPEDAPAEPDIALIPDAFEGGLMLQQTPEHHVPLRDPRQALTTGDAARDPKNPAPDAKSAPAPKPTRPEPVTLTGTVKGNWGFDHFTGPTMKLQQLPGGEWHIVSPDGSSTDLIAGKNSQILLASSGSACVHTISATPGQGHEPIHLNFKDQPNGDHPNLLSVALPGDREISPGSLNLEIQQYGQPKPDGLSAKTFADPPHIASVQLAAGDRTMLLQGTNLGSIDRLTLGDLVFKPQPDPNDAAPGTSLRVSMAANAPPPPTHPGDHLSAQMMLNDGRQLSIPLTVLPARPAVSLLSRSFDPEPGSVISLSSPDDLPLASHVSFTLKSRSSFPRNGRVEIETLDGTLRAVLTLAPAGGLVLQDPHTVVAGLDPLRSFGPSAFGALQMRVVFPDSSSKNKHIEPAGVSNDPAQAARQDSASAPADDNLVDFSDWLPLGTLVRLPVLAHLQCSADATVACNLSGSNLFLLQSVSADPAFTNADPVPDGFTGGTLPVPHPAGSAGTLFLKLRDDPTPVDSAILPPATVTTQASTTHTHGTSSHN